jgi:site-specific recombinase XerD
MDALYQQFIREKQYLHNVSPRTVDGYHWAWKAFEPALAGRTCVAKPEVLQRVEELSARGLGAVTINTYLRSVNAFCHWLFNEGHAQIHLQIPRLKEEQHVLATFTQDQVAKLVGFRATTLTERRIHMLACLILDTGLRISEALSLKTLTDIDLDQAVIIVRHGKGGKSRIVPISHQLRRLLFKFTQKDQPQYGDLLFFADAGEPLEQRNALRDFKHVCDKLGITGVRCSFHTLRHSFALAYVKHGGDVFRLQRILGHSKLEMSRRYVNLSLSDLQEVHQRLSLLANTGR